MKLVNRTVAVVRPTRPYAEWAQAIILRAADDKITEQIVARRK